MIAMLIGAIGLMGTLAVQQSITSAAKNANDGAIALRLASQKMEEILSRPTETPTVDAFAGLAPLATPSPGKWSAVDYLDAQGDVLTTAPTGANLSVYRWQRIWRVVDQGSTKPYSITTMVTYQNDVGTPKPARLDAERRKSW